MAARTKPVNPVKPVLVKMSRSFGSYMSMASRRSITSVRQIGLDASREQLYDVPGSGRSGIAIMSTQDNLALVREAYAAFGAGNLQGLLGLMTSDIVWEFPPSKIIPWSGTFTGPAEVGRFFASLMEHSEPQAFEPLHFVASEDRVIVLGRERFRVKSTYATWECEWAHAFTVRDGKIARFREYTDTAAVASAFGKPG